MDSTDVIQIVEYMRKLADPLATQAYELALKQIQFMLIMDIVYVFVCLGILVTTVLITKGMVNKMKEDGDYDFLPLPYIIGGFFVLAFLGLLLTNIDEIVNIIVNPDWVAIKLILNLAGK